MFKKSLSTFSIVAALAISGNQSASSQIIMGDWTDESNGILNGFPFTFSNDGQSVLINSTFFLSTAYNCLPYHNGATQAIEYSSNANVSINFAIPIRYYLFASFWRPGVYTFNAPMTLDCGDNFVMINSSTYEVLEGTLGYGIFSFADEAVASLSISSTALFNFQYNILNIAVLEPAVIGATTISKSQICAGDEVTIEYDASGFFAANNEFRVQLSNPQGQFLNPTVLGIMQSQNPIPLNVTFPETLEPSNLYRIRVIASNPLTVGPTNANDITFDQYAEAYFDFEINELMVDFSDLSENATSWEWNFGDGNTSDLQNPTHTYAENGTYEVCLIASNNANCESESFCLDVTVEKDNGGGLSIKNNSKSQINIFPNPTSDFVLFSEQVSGSIADLTGRVIFNFNLQNNIDISALPAGVYTLKLQGNEDKIHTQKIIKK